MADGSGFDASAAELYALPPEGFTAARDERVRTARAAGDAALAAQLAQLRRPTVGAWTVNLLVRANPELLDQLLGLGEELRRAQQELRGDALRQLAAQRPAGRRGAGQGGPAGGG